MALTGQIGTKILKVENGVVRLLNDTVTNSYSIGLRIDKDFEWKHISKELHDLMVKELSEQKGQRW
jgi:hypothetical protein